MITSGLSILERTRRWPIWSLTMLFDKVARLLAVFTCSGIFWMMILFLVEKISMKHPLPGSTGLAIIVLVVAAFLLIVVVTQQNAVAFLVPPPD